MSLIRFFNALDDAEYSPYNRQVTHKSEQQSLNPAVDINESKDKYMVHAELPGIAKENVDLNITESSISLSGEFKSTREEKDGLRGMFSERRYGKFARSFNFPEKVDSENAKATFKDGVLDIVIPKLAKQDRSRKIEIS